MAKENWRRVFQVGDKQVLFTNLYDVDDDEHKVKASYIHDKMNAFAEFKLSFSNEERADKFFDSHATQENAELIVDGKEWL